MNPKRKLTQEDLETHLKEQISFMESSADSFDAGFESEAKRLALAIRILVHDTKNSKSLLGQLDKKNCKFIDSASDYDPSNLLSHGGLVSFYCGPLETRYIAMLDDKLTQAKHVNFEEWWNKIAFIDNQRRTLTRKQLILAACNQDGGGHVDPDLDEDYAAISKDNSLGWMINEGGDKRPLQGAARVAIRQIAHEVLKTLKPGYSKKLQQEQPKETKEVSTIEGLHPPIVEYSIPPLKKKIGRNDQCPCGSGLKYKRCHGK